MFPAQHAVKTYRAVNLPQTVIADKASQTPTPWPVSRMDAAAGAPSPSVQGSMASLKWVLLRRCAPALFEHLKTKEYCC